MTSVSAGSVPEDGESKAKVFISYSRKDMEFANRLVAALTARNFAVLIDRTEIYAFDPWWERIQELIGQADTVIFALSPDSVASPVALKEVAHAASLNKRFAPIVCRPVKDSEVPEQLRRLNFIFFDDPATFEARANELAEALRTDIGWIRQHTAQGEAARHWSKEGWPNGLLLRSPALEEAERWIASRPANAPAPTDETQTYILASRVAATRRRNLLTASLSAGLTVALALAALAAWQWREAATQRDRAEQTVAAATGTANSLVADAALKLRDMIGVPIEVVTDILDQTEKLQDQLIAYNKDDVALQRSRAIARREISQTLRIQGDGEAALKTGRDALTIVNGLLAADPKNPELQRDLSLTLNRIGEALATTGHDQEALDYFKRSLTVRIDLLALAPEIGAQKDLATSYERVGDELFKLGQSDQASQAYKTSLTIRQTLADATPDDSDLQFDLAVSYDRMARLAGEGDEALALYRNSLAIRQKLADKDPRNGEWQRALAASYDSVAACLSATGHNSEALDSYKHGLQIRQQLADRNPEIARWQALVALSLYNLGRAGDLPQQRYSQALEILYKLAVAGKLPKELRELPAAIEQLRKEAAK